MNEIIINTLKSIKNFAYFDLIITLITSIAIGGIVSNIFSANESEFIPILLIAIITFGIYLVIRCVILIYLSINLKNISKIKEGE